jgi:arylsulfatase A-like enzyme
VTRRRFLATPAALAAAQQTAVQRPNILLIMTDQQTHDAWSGASNPWLRTPAMDSLAARGTTFSEAICPYPVCSPSRSGIFTGRMPHEAGVMVNGKPIASGMATMGEVFRAGGYETVYGGKWHLPKSFDGMTSFEKLIGGSGQGKDMDAPLATTCAGWLRKRTSREPFFMVASFMNPHDVCEWIRQHKGHRDHPNLRKYPHAPVNMAIDPNEPEPVRYHRREGYDLMSQAVGIASEWQRDDFRQYIHDYYRMVEAVDLEVGRVLKALDESGLAKNTVVAFCSDHGEGMGAHRWVQKAAFYEPSVRVPLMLAGPGIPAGVVRSELANLTDLMPTFCDLAGIQRPGDLRGIGLTKDDLSSRSFVVSELRYGTEDREGRMVRTKRYKYMAFNNGPNAEQLFDLELDPGETFNLVRQAGTVLEDHRALLKGWLSKTDDGFRTSAG